MPQQEDGGGRKAGKAVICPVCDGCGTVASEPTAWVVYGACGAHSDRQWWLVAVCSSKASAESLRQRLESDLRRATERDRFITGAHLPLDPRHPSSSSIGSYDYEEVPMHFALEVAGGQEEAGAQAESKPEINWELDRAVNALLDRLDDELGPP